MPERGSCLVAPTLFLVAKKDGSYRPVVNLKLLNCFVQKDHFKMEGLVMIKDLFQSRDWMCALDLKDVYLSVSVSLEDRKYLCFIWDGRMYKFTYLPFGLCCVPRTFTKLLCPAMARSFDTLVAGQERNFSG